MRRRHKGLFIVIKIALLFSSVLFTIAGLVGAIEAYKSGPDYISVCFYLSFFYCGIYLTGYEITYKTWKYKKSFYIFYIIPVILIIMVYVIVFSNKHN